MALDSSIYNLIRPVQPWPGPLEQYAQVAQIKNMMGAGELQDLQRQQLRQGMETQGKLRDLFARGNVKPEEIMAVDPATGLSFQKNQLDSQKTKGEIEKLQIDRFASASKQMRDIVATARGDADMPVIREAAMRLFGPDVAAKMNIPERFDPAWQLQTVQTGDQFIAQLESQRNRDVTLRGQDLSADTARRGQDLSATTTREGHAVTTRGQDLTDARAREQAARDQYGPAQEVTGPDGKPRLVMQRKNDGAIVDANTKEPIAGVGPKAGERATQQQAGVANVKNAIAEYREALKSWGTLDIANPNARARMGTIYNNMMLQAKEAYNLGVLNGPDYKILTDVVTDPTSLKGGITGKGAMDDQAKKLDEIMTRIGQTVTATQSGVTPPAPVATRPPANRPPLSSIFGNAR